MSEFPDKILDLADVRAHFSRTACCGDNCMQILFCMPVDKLALPMGASNIIVNKHSVAASSSARSARDDDYGEQLQAFEAKLLAARFQTAPFRRDTGNPRAMTDFLVDHFAEKRNPISRKWLYDISIAGQLFKMCRNSWMGVMGVTANELEYAQSKVRDGTTSTVQLHTKDAVKTKQAVFREFGLDVDDYHRHLRGMVDYNMVPDNTRHHIALAFLASPRRFTHPRY